MGTERFPKPGEIYNHFKDKPYQIITVATHTETGEAMVVYQAMYGDFKTYVRSLETFLSEVDHEKYPEIKQKYRFELTASRERELETRIDKKEENDITNTPVTPLVIKIENKTENEKELLEKGMDLILEQSSEDTNFSFNQNASDNPIEVEVGVNAVLLKFLDAESYSKKLDVLTSNRKHISDRLINDMAVSLDCAIDEGPLDQRIQGLVFCLQAMCRFEDRRLR